MVCTFMAVQSVQHSVMFGPERIVLISDSIDGMRYGKMENMNWAVRKYL